MSALKQFRHKTAEDLGIPLELVNAAIDFQWSHIKQEVAKDELRTIELPRIGSFYFSDRRTLRYLKKAGWMLFHLRNNPNAANREIKINELAEKIRKIVTKLSGDTKRNLQLQLQRRGLCAEEAWNMSDEQLQALRQKGDEAESVCEGE